MEKRPVVAEIAGPSGAGKSTLSACLNSKRKDVRAGFTVWGLPTTTLMFSAFTSLPTIAGLCIERKAINVDELKQVVRLAGFFRILKKNITGDQNHRALFLDEGVVFALAKLHADIGNSFTNGRLKLWEEKMLDRWAEILDIVIWLDAPDAVLIERIRTRAKAHRMKEKSEMEICEFLRRYRAAYKSVIRELKQRGRVRVVKFQTGIHETEGLTNEILELVCRERSSPGAIATFARSRGIKNEHAI